MYKIFEVVEHKIAHIFHVNNLVSICEYWLLLLTFVYEIYLPAKSMFIEIILIAAAFSEILT